MELLPIGPVVLLDTAGIDDASALAEARLEKAKKALQRTDVLVIVVSAPEGWSGYEDALVNDARAQNIPALVVINKTDLEEPLGRFSLAARRQETGVDSGKLDSARRAGSLPHAFKERIQGLLPRLFTAPPSLIGDLCPPGGMAVLVVPIDLGAPQGRLIVPQVQALRDLLDNDASALVVKDREYAATPRAAEPDARHRRMRFPSCRTSRRRYPRKCPSDDFSILFSRSRAILSSGRGAAATKTQGRRQNPHRRRLFPPPARRRHRPRQNPRAGYADTAATPSQSTPAPDTTSPRTSKNTNSSSTAAAAS